MPSTLYYIPMNNQEHQEFLRSLKQSQEQSKRTLERIQQTLKGVSTTLSDIKETNENIDKIKTSFSDLMDRLAIQVAGSFSSPIKKVQGHQYAKLPKKVPMKEAVKQMLKNDNVLFVTGAGVSVASGVPTFRGQNGLYSKKFKFKDQQMDPQEFITKRFFSEHPEAIWQWIDEIYQMSINNKSNEVHQLIHECALALTKKKKKVTLVTQNIDDLHIRPQDNEYEYHCIHGNAKFMRCQSNHMRKYQKSQCMGNCQKCGQKLRPHVMFFDESYGVPFGGQVKDRQFPFVIVIGTSLNTGLCIKLVGQAEKIIEINPQPVIQIGDVHPFDEDTVAVLRQMLECLNKQ